MIVAQHISPSQKECRKSLWGTPGRSGALQKELRDNVYIPGDQVAHYTLGRGVEDGGDLRSPRLPPGRNDDANPCLSDSLLTHLLARLLTYLLAKALPCLVRPGQSARMAGWLGHRE